MTIGTSLGGHYQDEHHYQARDYLPNTYELLVKSDIQKSVDKAIKGITWEDDPDLIRNPLEISPDDTNPYPVDIMGTDQMQMQRIMRNDPGNIYNESGEIVDYKEGGQWGVPDLPIKEPYKQLIHPLDRVEEFNEIDALADRKTDEQIRKDNEE